MPAGWAAAAAAVVGGVMQADAAGDAADQAAQGQANSLALQREMFNKQNDQQGPYRQAGYTGLDQILKGFGLPQTGYGNQVAGARNLTAYGNGVPEDALKTIAAQYGENSAQVLDAIKQAKVIGTPEDGYRTNVYKTSDIYKALQPFGEPTPIGPVAAGTGDQGVQEGYFAHQFGANDLNANLAPNWAFSLQQGINAGKNAGNLQTGLISGNTMKGLADYTLAKSGDLYQQAYNNYTANQSNIFNRLSTLAGLGSAANQQSSGLAGSLAPSMGQAAGNIGAAQAAGTVGQASALSGAANIALVWYQLSNLNRPASNSSNYNASGQFTPYYSRTDSAGGPAYG